MADGMAVSQLREGTPFRLRASGLAGTVGALIGAGGQGAAYHASIGGKPFVLKWYHPHVLEADTRLPGRIARAVERGSPDPRFLWPIDLVEVSGREGLGHLMALRPPRFRGLRDLIAAPPARIDPPLVVRARTCLSLAESFLHLHAKGLCYQDINFGAVFIEPSSGEICICDNDNVDVNGAPASVYGTKKFMAPEIVRGERMPDAGTDLYSMAVMFFYVLHAWHPLEGRAEYEVALMDAEEEMRLYGTQPRFMFDPADASNGPVAGFHDAIVRRWRSLSEGVRRLFVQAFTAGLRPGPAGRVIETQWRAALARMADSILACPACGYEHALDAEDADPDPRRFACVACGAEVPLPPRLLLGRDAVVLCQGAQLHAHHLDPARPFVYGEPLARVEAHPADPAVTGLRNLTADTWTSRLPDGTGAAVPPGRTIRLVDGLEVDFGRRRGTVAAGQSPTR
ncbi:protein kinase domain-containing protein [Salinarimonas soli]|uniref:Serine/threonine protein kinase n=1 Tax=Salinarimonas soli TaxID=1638099 RepID=A0A5B2V9E4_9HYPH|nr:serine/threonine protein kinase [Salinarimonas soli]KAA2234959.1 serine/threonine protein kinase [Salinarimonas soli]